MRRAWQEIWGSARGPARRLAPRTRILCGAGVFTTCLVAPATTWPGVAVITASVALWVALVRPPARVVRAALLLGLVLFLPYFLIVPLALVRSDAGGGWLAALCVAWTVFWRGMTAMQASITTATALSASALRQGLGRLPIPRVLSEVLVQIVHQAAGLVRETDGIASAVAVRGGTTGYRTAIRVLCSIPRVWLPRVVERAERVGAAMELRGYCEREPPERKQPGRAEAPAASSPADGLALTAALLLLAGAIALRVWGGA
jgi:energy-coupling factor transporter transmembrane protein EcfT